MAVENPPLNRIYVLGYSANDRSFPILAQVLDPRVAGYKVPEDLSTCPDKRYPNHVFTGAQPISGDERVRHVWELLPSPYVPFTRYDDDLGPVQGRRRSVKNEGQVASREADKQITYDAREGSAIVYTELEETWSIATDDDGNSLFPIRDRDFYDPSRGPVQERRQLLVPTGEEAGSLVNVNGVITQTSYEPYNDFLSVKIVQTYGVDGPQLVGNTTDNDGQLVTVTTQRKGANGYVPPNPTATRTVEVSREDAEALIERIVDTPEVFKANTFSVERPDPIPQKFRVAVPIQSSQEIVEGDAEVPTLSEGEISKSEEQRNKFIKRVSSTSRDQAVLPQTLTGKSTNNERQEVTVTETLQLGNTVESPTATKTVESEALGDGNYVITKTEVDELFAGESYQKNKADLTPQKFRASQEDTTSEQTIEGIANANIILAEGEFSKSEQQINKFVKRISTTSRAVSESGTLSESVLTPEGLLATRTLVLAKGAQSFTPSATLVDANVESLGDGRTVKTETTIPNIFEAKSTSVERPDSTPTKFRVLVPSKTDQINAVGSVNQSITLAGGEVAKSETQQTQFVKRISSTSRDQAVLPQTLTGKSTNNERQEVTVTETLQEGNTVESPTATTTVESEALGDGNYVITKTEIPEVFSAKTLSVERPDPVPQKFRVLVPSTTEQETVEGDALQPVLIAGDLVKSEQQVNKFVKRTSTTSRDATQLPKSVNQKLTTNEGILATVTETLQSGDTADQPTATKTVESEALGDGTYVVRTTVAEIFSGQTFSVERPDVVPAKFRSSLQTKTDQKTVAGDAEVPSLEDSGELSKSEQQITKFLKRTSVTSRDANQLPKSFTQKSTDNDRQVVTVIETLQTTDSIEQPSATTTIQSEAVGEGLFVVTKSQVPEVFNAKSIQKTKADLTPQKFRAAQEDTVREENVAGGVNENLSLFDGEFSKSEQQINKFVKRTSLTSRIIKNTPSLKESIITPEGQLATRVLTLAPGSQTLSPEAKLIDGNIEALGDGRTVKTETRVASVFPAKTISKTKVDLTPEKFKAKVEDETIEENVEGTINPSISLLAGEFKKSEQQVTQFVKRTSKTARTTETTNFLSEKVLTQQGQLATRKLTLGQAEQYIDNINQDLIEASVEALGDGRTVKTEVRLDGAIFDGKTKTNRQAIRIPEKFISKIDESSEVVVSETATPDILGTDGSGVAESSAQRLTEFTARKSKTELDIDSSVIEGQTNNVKQPIKITSSIEDSGNVSGSDVNAKTEFVRIQSIGGGKFVKEVGEALDFFKQRSYSQETPDPAPQKFRVEIPAVTEEFNEEKTEVSEGDSALDDGEISKTAQQIDAHTVRKRIVKRDSTEDAKLEGGKIFTTELNGGVADVTEEYHAGPKKQDIELGTVSFESEALGSGKFVTRTVKITEPKELKGSIYDEQFDVQIPFSRTIVAAKELNITDSSETTPRDPVQSIKTIYKKDEIKASLIQKKFTVGDIVNISLPDTLEGLKIITETAKDETTEEAEGTGNTVTISGKIGIDIDADFLATIKSGYSGPATAVRHFFFLPEDACSIDDILTATGAKSVWPIFKPQPVNFSLVLRQKSEQCTIQVSLPDNEATSVETDESVKVRVINIPPTLHTNIEIETPNPGDGSSKNIKVNKPTGGSVFQTINANAEMKTKGEIVATEPEAITGGNCLYSVSASPYKYGLIRVEAVTVDIDPYV